MNQWNKVCEILCAQIIIIVDGVFCTLTVRYVEVMCVLCAGAT